MKNYGLLPGRQQGVGLLIVGIVGSSLLIFNWGEFYQRHAMTLSHGDNGRGMKSQR